MPPDYRLYSLDENQIYSNNHPKLSSFESTNPGKKEPTAGRSAIKRKINSAAEAPVEVVMVTATTVTNKNSLRHCKQSKTNSI